MTVFIKGTKEIVSLV